MLRQRLKGRWSLYFSQGRQSLTLGALLIIGSAIALSITSYCSYRVLRNLIIENAKKNVMLKVEKEVEQIDSWLATQKAIVETIAQTPISQTLDWSVIKDYLKSEQLRLQGTFQEQALVKPNGIFHDSNGFEGSVKEYRYFQEVMQGEVYVSDPLVHPYSPLPLVAIAAPILSNSSDDKQSVGAILGLIPFEELFNFVSSLEFGLGSYAFVLNSQGRPIIHPDENLRGTVENPASSFLEEKDNALQNIALQMVAKQKGIEQISLDNRLVYTAYMPFGETDWSIALVIPHQNLEHPLETLNWLVLTMGGLLIFTTVAALRLALTRVALQQKYQLLSTTITNASVIVYVLDREGVIILREGKDLETIGLKSREAVGLSVFDICRDYPEIKENIRQVLAGYDADWVAKFAGRTFSNRGVPWRDKNGQIIGMIGVSTDITEQVKAEEKIKTSLQEKEFLVKEVHHRIKNNLQIVCSLLDLQSLQIQDPTIQEMFQASQRRVRSMAFIHEQLYRSSNANEINFTYYVTNLTSYLIRSYQVNSGKVQLKLNLDEDVLLPVDTAIPCGLIINELITNALKYAFPEDAPGEVWVEFTTLDDNLFCLVVRDNGVTASQTINLQETKSLGLQLISALVNQLDAQIEIEQNHGTAFKITFSANRAK